KGRPTFRPAALHCLAALNAALIWVGATTSTRYFTGFSDSSGRFLIRGRQRGFAYAAESPAAHARRAIFPLLCGTLVLP
ncbi:MAG: hypothetical protein ABIT83_10375, partial [Massilia sp.]